MLSAGAEPYDAQKDCKTSADRNRLPAERSRAVAFATWQRIVGRATADRHFYQTQAASAREQAERAKLAGIRERLLRIAESYDNLGKRAEHAVRAGRWGLRKEFAPAFADRAGD